MLQVRVSWRPSSQPKVSAVCPHNLYSRLHPEVSERTRTALAPRSRIASDGFKNIVLRKTARGYGRQGKDTRPYRRGEAADLARYVLRADALEIGINACFTNIVATEGQHALYETDGLSIDARRCSQIVAFWNALEAFEAEADADGNVFSHLILAMPHELSPEGRARALEDFCFRLDALHLPYVASLHRPDDKGDIRNFHAHIMFAPRPFAVEGPFAWSFEAGKATELNLTPALPWLRDQAAAAFNHALERERNPLRYSGVSQAKRGVPATGETHDGPALTARKRWAQADEEERQRLVRQLGGHVTAAIDRHNAIGSAINVESAKAVPKAATADHGLPAALTSLRAKFPDPLSLQGLSALDFADFTPQDHAGDRWYSPAYNLAAELRRGRWDAVRDREGRPELDSTALDQNYRSLLDAPALPDIVDEALREAHRQMLRERQSIDRIRREKERVRKERMKWLRGTPVPIFDANANVLPEHRHLFPPKVMELDGVRDAMVECHIAALATNKADAIATEAEPQVQDAPVLQSSPQSSGPVPVDSPTNDEDAWDLILAAAHAGKVSLPGSAVKGK